MNTVRLAVVAFLALAIAAVARAQVPQQSAPDEGPFVEHRLTLQVSDNAPATQHLAVNVAYNVLKAFGPDKVSIEIVAFGPGIDLLRADNPEAPRIASLIQQGVKFDACMNTVETIERDSGKPFPLNPLARKVPAGVVQIMMLAEHGYVTVRP